MVEEVGIYYDNRMILRSVPTTKNSRPRLVLSAALSSAVARRTSSSNRTVVPAATTCSFFSASLWQRKYVEVDEQETEISCVEQRVLRRVARELLY